ncbi:MAG: hydroxymethylglutaryl-CoA lyase [Saprospiraceae bacterium]|jgi:hydroxymethylglutaryl-CoA lyase|nr:hydroxymethylglutaryl-CoA lyase [Saprospiraceae bacterium]MDP4999501.1 hydroxymethylglutaryl-CoA lyase [Saprospiraceae bacterium]
MIKLIECPRDAMQGIKPFIPTATKAAYLNRLLRVGFDTLDFGSFVSPKAIPQMRDTAEVLSLLNFEGVSTRLLAIVANTRGAESAAAYQRIDYLGYPFSVSETFQLRNTNATIADSLERVAEIQEICQQSGKQLVVYLSMGFGNPYGDPWNVETVQRWVGRLAEMGVGIFQLSDTIGVATPASIAYLFGQLLPQYPDLEIGAHFHTQPHNWEEKIATAYQHGCRRFDGALRGYGGCPMARDTLTGNMPTENMIGYLDEQGVCPELDREVLREAMDMAAEIFP